MFIPRADGQSCQSPASCSSTGNPDSNQQSTRNNTTHFNTPVATRFIGVAVVAAAIILILVLWVWLGSWPKKALLKYGCCWRKRARPNGKDKDVVIDLSASLPDLKKPKRVRIRERKNEHGEMEMGASGVGEPRPPLPGRDPKSEHIPNNPNKQRAQESEVNDRPPRRHRRGHREDRKKSRKSRHP